MEEQLDLFPELKELEELRERVAVLEDALAKHEARNRGRYETMKYLERAQRPEIHKFVPACPVDTPRPYYYTNPSPDFFKPTITCGKG